PRSSSTRHLSRANSKLPNTLPASCMTCTSSRSTRSSGRERSGVPPMRLRLRSRNWTPSHNSRPQRSWGSSWKPGSHNRSSLGCGVGPTAPSEQVFHFVYTTHAGEARLHGTKRGVTTMFALFQLGQTIISGVGARIPAVSFLKRDPALAGTIATVREQGEILFQVHRLFFGETENRVAGVFQLPGSDRLKPSYG